MKEHIYFFILFTILEIALSTFYFLLVKTVNLTLLTGLVLYAAGMLSAYLSYREEVCREKKEHMLKTFLPGECLSG